MCKNISAYMHCTVLCVLADTQTPACQAGNVYKSMYKVTILQTGIHK